MGRSCRLKKGLRIHLKKMKSRTTLIAIPAQQIRLSPPPMMIASQQMWNLNPKDKRWKRVRMIEMSEIKLMRKKNTILMLAAVLILLSLGLLGGQLISQQYQPIDPTDVKGIDIHIPPASNAAEIAALLKAGIDPQQDFFVAYAAKGLDSQLKAGHYRFPEVGLGGNRRCHCRGRWCCCP